MTPEELKDLRRKRYNATLVRLRKPHPDLAILRVRPDFPRPLHRAGQYCTLGLLYAEPRFPGTQPETLRSGDEARLARRSYSISCAVLDDEGRLLDLERADWLEFYIVLVRDSGNRERPAALTPRLFLLREGERLAVGEKIAGNYTLDPVRPDDSVLFLATGTGEAPHNYMLWELLRRSHQGRILSACCVRYRRDLGYSAIHQELMRRYPNYTYLSLTTREAEAAGPKVYLQDLITSGQLEDRLGQRLDPARTHVFLCGNPKMIGAPIRDRQTGAVSYPKPTGVVELFERRGFFADQPNVKTRGNIHFEEYW
jgi:ferredoxin--NADP+ reductase